MKDREKYNFIIRFVKHLKPSLRIDYCNGSQMYHESLGDDTTTSNSINKNWLTGYYGSIPKSKLGRQYDYTNIFIETLIERGQIEEDFMDIMGGKAPDIDNGVPEHDGGRLEGAGTVGNFKTE